MDFVKLYIYFPIFILYFYSQIDNYLIFYVYLDILF